MTDQQRQAIRTAAQERFRDPPELVPSIDPKAALDEVTVQATIARMSAVAEVCRSHLTTKGRGCCVAIRCIDHPEWGVFESIDEAARRSGHSSAGISSAVKRGGTCRGLKWERATGD